MPDRHLTALNEEEKALVLKAPVLVTLLIAGADQNVSTKEVNWAKKVIHYRTFTENQRLHDYYEAVSETFEDVLSQHLEGDEAQLTEAFLTGELTKLSDILPKIDKTYAQTLLKSLRSLANHIAEADGGLLGFHRVGADEQRLVELPMITF